MNEAFWQQCWQRNSLGFHQEQVHPFLEKYLEPLLKDTDQHVLVPLCGKSLDMVWLAEKLNVTGAELSDIACRDFFVEKSLPYTQRPYKNFQQFYLNDLSLWHGDFFQFLPEMVAKIDWIYDRAALIALPKEMQGKYVEHLKQFIHQGCKVFLISLEFPEQELTGPPFPIFEQDIYHLFSAYNVECLASYELKNKKFAQRQFDVGYLRERLYLISSV